MSPADSTVSGPGATTIFPVRCRIATSIAPVFSRIAPELIATFSSSHPIAIFTSSSSSSSSSSCITISRNSTTFGRSATCAIRRPASPYGHSTRFAPAAISFDVVSWLFVRDTMNSFSFNVRADSTTIRFPASWSRHVTSARARSTPARRSTSSSPASPCTVK